MALNKKTLENEIVSILSNLLERDDELKEGQKNPTVEFAAKLSNAIDDYVKNAEIKYTSGLVAPTSGGPVTGSFTGKLS